MIARLNRKAVFLAATIHVTRKISRCCHHCLTQIDWDQVTSKYLLLVRQDECDTPKSILLIPTRTHHSCNSSVLLRLLLCLWRSFCNHTNMAMGSSNIKRARQQKAFESMDKRVPDADALFDADHDPEYGRPAAVLPIVKVS